LAEHRIPPLTDTERVKLRTLMEWLKESAGIPDVLMLHAQLDAADADARRDERLDVFVTTPSVSSLTGCQHSNAVYDPQLDAIFIDRELIYPLRYLVQFRDMAEISSLTEGDLAGALRFLDVYLRFVVAHELGHRKLRHWSNASVAPLSWVTPEDRATRLQQLETDADAFALEVLTRAGDHVPPLFRDDQNEELNIFNLPMESPLSAQARAQLAVMNAAFAMVSFRPLGFTVHSLTYQDMAHLPFVRRIQRLAQAIVVNSTDQAVRNHAQFLAVVADALSRLPSRGVTEYLFPRSMYTVALVNHDLYAVPQDDRGVFATPLREGSDASHRQWVDVSEKDIVGVSHPISSPDDRFAIAGLDDGSVLRVDEQSGLFALGADRRWVQLRPAIQGTETVAGERDIRTAAQPAHQVMILRGSEVESVRAAGRVTRALREMVDDVARAIGGASDDLDLNLEAATIVDDVIHTAVTARTPTGPASTAVATFGGDLQLRGTKKLLRRHDAPKADGSRTALMAFPLEGKPTVLEVRPTTVLVQGDPLATGWEIMDLSSSQKEVRLAAGQLLRAQLGTELLGYAPIRRVSEIALRGLWYVPPHYLLMNWENDFIVLADLSSGRSRPLSYPGFEDLRVVVGQKGVALFMESGYRLQYFDPRRVFD
jgi:hypothetical protein